jgi:hypothetical protein
MRNGNWYSGSTFMHTHAHIHARTRFWKRANYASVYVGILNYIVTWCHVKAVGKCYMSKSWGLDEGYNLLETSRFGWYSNIPLVKVQSDASEDQKQSIWTRVWKCTAVNKYVPIHLRTTFDSDSLTQIFSQEAMNIICISLSMTIILVYIETRTGEHSGPLLGVWLWGVESLSKAFHNFSLHLNIRSDTSVL